MEKVYNKARSASAGAWPEELRSWLKRRAESHVIDHVRPMRTSSDNVTKWQASATTTFAASDRRDPDVRAALDEVGFDVVRRDPIGESKRRELGDQVFVLQMRHAPGGRGKRQLGVAVHIGRTIFIHLLASARANNLDAETDDRRGNAATEIIATVVRVVAEAGRRRDPGHRPHVYAREHARIVRDEQHGADLKATFVQCRVIAHTPHTTDMTRPSDAQSFSFGSMLSAASAEANVLGMSRADVVIQANGGYNSGIRQVPFTHGPLVRHEVDIATGMSVTTSDKHRLAPVADVEEARRQLRCLVDKILEDRWDGARDRGVTDWEAVGELMAELGMHSRMPAHLKDGRQVPLSTLTPAGRGRAARTLFGTQWISGWRDGYYEKLVIPKTAMDLDLTNLEHVTEELTRDGRVAYRCRIAMPLPDDGWGITSEEWDEVLRRRSPNAGETRVYTGDVLPLAGLPEWTDADGGEATRQYDVTTKSSRYVLVSRPIAEAHRMDGTRRGWEDCTVSREAGVRAAEIHHDLGRRIGDALVSLEALTAPVLLTPLRRAEPAAPAATTGRSLADIEAELDEAQNQRRGAADARNTAKGIHEKEQTEDSADELADAEEDLERAKTRIRSLRDELRRHDAEKATTPARATETERDPVEVGVETARPEFIAAALEKCRGSAPGWLQEAVHLLLSDFRLEPYSQPGARRMVRWTATLNLHTVDADGGRELVTMPLAGEVRDHTNARGGSAIAHGPESWAWSFFYRGEDFAAIAERAAIDGSGKKNSYLYRGLSEWLTLGTPTPVPNVHMRTAALDCPIPETRRVLWRSVTQDASALTGIDPRFVEHIRHTYASTLTAPRWSWCKDTHTLARAAATIMLGRGGSAPIYELAQELNVAPDKLLSLARENGKPTKGRDAAKQAPVAVAPFTKNWQRGGVWTPADQRELSLRPCPHPDCPERLRGGTPYASHILIVPETETGHGALCPTCCRLPVPSLASVRFPSNYLRPWRGRFGYGSHAGARDYAGSHIDPNRLDRGAADPLPDTGTLPRPETMVTKSGNYAAKRLRREPMAGARLLPLGLAEDDRDTVCAEVTRLGGQIAAKVTRTLAYVVVSDIPATSDVARRAALLGAEVLTLAQFEARAKTDWSDCAEPA